MNKLTKLQKDWIDILSYEGVHLKKNIFGIEVCFPKDTPQTIRNSIKRTFKEPTFISLVDKGFLVEKEGGKYFLKNINNNK